MSHPKKAPNLSSANWRLLNELFFGAHPWLFAPHIPAVHSETNTKAQKLPATLSTSGHYGRHDPYFIEDTTSCSHYQSTKHNCSLSLWESSPDGQTLILLPSNCKASWQTPDHATFRTPTEPSPPTKTCYHGTTHWRIRVVGASSFGSHTLSGFFNGLRTRHTSP